MSAYDTYEDRQRHEREIEKLKADAELTKQRAALLSIPGAKEMLASPTVQDSIVQAKVIESQQRIAESRAAMGWVPRLLIGIMYLATLWAFWSMSCDPKNPWTIWLIPVLLILPAAVLLLAARK